MRLRYWSEECPKRHDARVFTTMVRAGDEQFYVRFAVSEFDLQSAKVTGWHKQLLARKGEQAAYELWKGLRKTQPLAFEIAVEQGWTRAPNDCAGCGGRGYIRVSCVDEFREALQGDCYDRITGQRQLPVPTHTVEQTCPACNGRRWA